MNRYRTYRRQDGKPVYCAIEANDMEAAVVILRQRYPDATGLQVWNPEHWPARPDDKESN